MVWLKHHADLISYYIALKGESFQGLSRTYKTKNSVFSNIDLK